MTSYNPNTPTRLRVAVKMRLAQQHEDEVAAAIAKRVAEHEVSQAVARYRLTAERW